MTAKRDAKGRFIKGSSGNPAGRSPREIEAGQVEAFSRACPPEKFQLIIERQVAKALQGDIKAAAFVASYLIGLPVKRVEDISENKQTVIVEYIDTDTD